MNRHLLVEPSRVPAGGVPRRVFARSRRRARRRRRRGPSAAARRMRFWKRTRAPPTSTSSPSSPRARGPIGATTRARRGPRARPDRNLIARHLGRHPFGRHPVGGRPRVRGVSRRLSLWWLSSRGRYPSSGRRTASSGGWRCRTSGRSRPVGSRTLPRRGSRRRRSRGTVCATARRGRRRRGRGGARREAGGWRRRARPRVPRGRRR